MKSLTWFDCPKVFHVEHQAIPVYQLDSISLKSTAGGIRLRTSTQTARPLRLSSFVTKNLSTFLFFSRNLGGELSAPRSAPVEYVPRGTFFLLRHTSWKVFSDLFHVEQNVTNRILAFSETPSLLHFGGFRSR